MRPWHPPLFYAPAVLGTLYYSEATHTFLGTEEINVHWSPSQAWRQKYDIDGVLDDPPSFELLQQIKTATPFQHAILGRSKSGALLIFERAGVIIRAYETLFGQGVSVSPLFFVGQLVVWGLGRSVSRLTL
jgi:hypothetical protein